jgi:hypothetical protein
MSSVPSINKYYFIAGRGNFLVLASNNETRKAAFHTRETGSQGNGRSKR